MPLTSVAYFPSSVRQTKMGIIVLLLFLPISIVLRVLRATFYVLRNGFVGYGSWYMAESGRCTSPPKTNASNPSQYTKKEEPSSRLTPYLHTLDEYIRTFAHHVRVIL